MKKLLSLCLLVMALGMFTIGCSGASDTSTPPETPAAGGGTEDTGAGDTGATEDTGAADAGSGDTATE